MPRCNQCGDHFPELHGPLDAISGDLCADCWQEASELIAAEAANPGSLAAVLAIVLPPDPWASHTASEDEAIETGEIGPQGLAEVQDGGEIEPYQYASMHPMGIAVPKR